MTPSATSDRKFVTLKIVRAEAPYESVFLKSEFPTPMDDLPIVSAFLDRMVAAATQGRKMNLEAFVQINPLAAIAQMARMTDHAREWQPIMGLGIWPDREPPTSWTKEDFLKLLPGKAPRITKYMICRISASGKIREQAWMGLLGTGAVLTILTGNDTAAFLKRTKDVLLPPIKDESFRHSPVYVPLFECKSFDSARAEQLDSWFCGASLYIRESTEDGGVLIASREPLKPLLENLGGRLTDGSHAGWQIPS